MLGQYGRMTLTAGDLLYNDVKAARAWYKDVIGALEALILRHLKLRVDAKLAFAVLTPDENLRVLKKTRLLDGHGWGLRS